MHESKLYTLIDKRRFFVWYFLEGEQLIADLAVLHNLNPTGLHFFRNTTLSAQLLISTLKQHEHLGFYLDITSPKLLLKLESSFSGRVRTLLLPENPVEYPEKVSGMVRIVKSKPHADAYTSHIELKGLAESELIDTILEKVYQTPSKVLLASKTDRSVMITRLPLVGMSQQEREEIPELGEYIAEQKATIDSLFTLADTTPESIAAECARYNLKVLGSKEIVLKCDCSHDLMRHNLGLYYANQTHLPAEEEPLELRCDYCKSTYQFSPEEIATIRKGC